MLSGLYTIIPAFIKCIFFIAGAGLEAYSDYLTAEYLSLGASTPNMKEIMWWVGILLGVIRFFMSPIAFSRLKYQYSISAISQALCVIILTTASIIFSVGFFDSSSDNLIREAAIAERALKDRDQKITEAKLAIKNFDDDSRIEKKAYEGLIEKGRDSKAISANRERQEKRQYLVDKYNEALSLPCEKVPDIGQLNKMYIGLTQFLNPSIKEEYKFNEKMRHIRLWVNIIIAFCIDFALLNALVTSGFGEVIDKGFSNKKENTEQLVSPQPELVSKEQLDAEISPKKEEITSPHQNFFYKTTNSKSLIVKNDNWSPTGLQKNTEPVSQVVSSSKQLVSPQPEPVSKEQAKLNEEYEEVLDYVRDFKRLYPNENCGVNKIKSHFSIRKDRACKIFERGMVEGFFYKKGQGYEPTEKLLKG